MPDFVLNRNYSMRTMHGHIIDFKKGAPTYVPPVCVKDAVAIGASPVHGDIDILEPDPVDEAPMTVEERQENIITAFKMVEERAQREDFTAAGSPTQAALIKILGFNIDKKEYEPIWTAYTAEKGVAE